MNVYKNFINNLEELSLSRIINPESSGKERTRLSREVVLSIRELMKQTNPDEQSLDMAAFIALALNQITNTIESSVVAWEKRGYWVKADRFRMEWVWTERLGLAMRQALIDGDWLVVASTSAQIGQKLSNIQIPLHHRLGTPWVGAWEVFKKNLANK
jgi:hypothetical protein